MYRWVVHTERYDSDSKKDLAAYSAILDNPLCIVLEKRCEKISDKDMCDGEISSIHERIVMVVTWKEKQLL